MTASLRIEIDTSGHQVSAFSLTSTGAVVASSPMDLGGASQGVARIVCIEGAGYLSWAEGVDPSAALGRRMQAGDVYSLTVGAGLVLKWLEAGISPLNVLPPFSRCGTAGVTFTPNGNYAAGACMGLRSIDLLADYPELASADIKIVGINMTAKMASNTTPGGNLLLELFAGAPAGTFTDGAVPAWAGAGLDEVRRNLGLSFIVGAASGTVAYYGLTPPQPIEATTDAEGKIHFVPIVGTAMVWGTPGITRLWIDFLY